jgi:hypothetical protein
VPISTLRTNTLVLRYANNSNTQGSGSGNNSTSQAFAAYVCYPGELEQLLHQDWSLDARDTARQAHEYIWAWHRGR